MESPPDPLEPRDPQFQAAAEPSRLLRLSRHPVFHMICSGQLRSASPGRARRVVQKALLNVVGHHRNGSTPSPRA